MSRKTSIRFHFGSPLSSKVVVCGHWLLTLFLIINEALKSLSSLSSNVGVILVVIVQCYVQLPSSPTPWDFSPHQYLFRDNSASNQTIYRTAAVSWFQMVEEFKPHTTLLPMVWNSAQFFFNSHDLEYFWMGLNSASKTISRPARPCNIRGFAKLGMFLDTTLTVTGPF